MDPWRSASARSVWRSASRIAPPEHEAVSPVDLAEGPDGLVVLDRGDPGDQVDGPIDRASDQHVVLRLRLGRARIEPVRKAPVAPGQQVAALAPPCLTALHRRALRVRLDVAGEEDE